MPPEITDMFFAANASRQALILHNLNETPLKASAPIHRPHKRAIETLEMAAFAELPKTSREIGEAPDLCTGADRHASRQRSRR